MTQLQPVAAADRIEAMDVLRGVALLGILLMNIEAFVGAPTSALTGLDPALEGADRFADAAIALLVQGKFYPLFSLLFGMGFAVMMARANAAGRPFFALYLRRTVALLAIGLAHLLLIWSGDILTVYAVVALPLLLVFRSVPWRQLPYWAAGLYLLNVVIVFGLNALGSVAQMEPTLAAEMDRALQLQAAEMQRLFEAERAAYGTGSYVDAVLQRARDAQAMLPMMLFVSGQVLAMFVLGAWFVGSGAIARPADFPRFYRFLRWIALPSGLALALLSFRMVPTLEYDRLDATVGAASALLLLAALPVCLGYLAWILRGLDSPLAPALRWVAPAGRMALTNYLSQSVVCTLIFYGYGLGYFERLPRAGQVPFAIALFALQVLCSHWWLARFRYGPMEWLWRAVTYLQWPPLRRTA